MKIHYNLNKMQLVKLQSVFKIQAQLFNFIITSIAFEIWLKCTDKVTDKYLWWTKIIFKM